MSPERRPREENASYLRFGLPMVLWGVAVVSTIHPGNILSRDPPAWVSHWPFALRLSFAVLYDVLVIAISAPIKLKALLGSYISVFIAGSTAYYCGASTLVTALVSLPCLIPFFYWFWYVDYRKRKKASREP